MRTIIDWINSDPYKEDKKDCKFRIDESDCKMHFKKECWKCKDFKKRKKKK